MRRSLAAAASGWHDSATLESHSMHRAIAHNYRRRSAGNAHVPRALSSVSITPWPTPLQCSLPLSPLPACLKHLRRALKRTLYLEAERALRACVRGHAGARPLQVSELNSHVRSNESGLLVCQGNIILGDDAYTPRGGCLAPTRDSKERERE